MILKLIKHLIFLIKGRRIEFDDAVNLSYILSLTFEKIFKLIRGLLCVRKFVYLGKHSCIKSSNRLKLTSKNIEIGSYCIIDCLSREGVNLGCNFKIGDFSRIIASGTLRDVGVGVFLGDNVAIGEYAYIGGAGGVDIGSDCIIGQYFSVHPENHVFTDLNLKIRNQGVTRKGIAIGDNCWIGAKVTICDGVKIGNGCIIAAGSVVTRSFPDNSVIGGVPARMLKGRCE